MALIEVRHVSKVFGPAPKKALALVREGMGKDELLARTRNVLALDDVTLSVERGETFVVMGLSGSGKSTLIRHLNRLIDPTEGEIRIDGVDVLGLPNRGLETFRREKTAMVFQRFGLLPHRTVIDNVAYGLEIRGVAKAERRTRAAAWVSTVGLAGYEDRYP
ncbi:MAG: ATP-binding cassette domain-containing protein, partial [Alphaproteobacteria bacterium]|nr:ATP-binding cassette domain-containing protein [Alphaproteobacteria bacterium]